MRARALDEEHDLEPISYLVAKQEQQPCEVVVLSLVSNQPKIHIESLAGYEDLLTAVRSETRDMITTR